MGRTTTADDGTYSITDISLSAGPEGTRSMTVRAFADGYEPGVSGVSGMRGCTSRNVGSRPAVAAPIHSIHRAQNSLSMR